MYENKCVICGQPILGYWYEVGKKNICQSCAATTTVYDLFQRDIVDINPDIVDSNATLVTKDDDRYPFNDDGYHYTDEDFTEALKIINDIKAHGCNTECEFFDECQKLWDAGISDTDNSLLILRKQYEEIMPSPRYEGDTGNDTWGAMYHLWQ